VVLPACTDLERDVAASLVGSVTAAVDDEEIGEVWDACGEPWEIELPNPNAPRREVQLRVETRPGCSGGAMLAGPLVFRCGPGRMVLGDWQVSGLADYSGLVRYRQEVALADTLPSGRVVLDLSDVRGTVEATANGQRPNRRHGRPGSLPVRRDGGGGAGRETGDRIAGRQYARSVHGCRQPDAIRLRSSDRLGRIRPGAAGAHR
jgi:hypothetical protein